MKEHLDYFHQYGLAQKRMEQARAKDQTWVVTIPGCIALYEAPNRNIAESLITRSMQKQGYVTMPKSNHNYL